MNSDWLASQLIDLARAAGVDDAWWSIMRISRDAGDYASAVINAVDALASLNAAIPDALVGHLDAFAADMSDFDRPLLRYPVTA